jgi:hypothetical protein
MEVLDNLHWQQLVLVLLGKNSRDKHHSHDCFGTLGSTTTINDLILVRDMPKKQTNSIK